MLSTAVFGVSLVGLVVLFGLKAFELARDAKTPLHHVRRVGDPFVSDSWASFSNACKTFFVSAAHTSTAWTKTNLHKAHLSFDALMHALAARLNRYLRGRRVQTRQNGNVSTHLKTVLEKTEDTTRPNSL